MKTLTRLLLCGIALLAISGCSYNVGFNSSYLPPAGIAGKHDGKVLVLMSQQEQDWVYSGHPTSYTASATTLSVPLGNITKQVALEVFSRHFTEVDFANARPAGGQYTMVVNPRVSHFEYAYNQLKNLGFAITPEIKLDLDVTLYDAKGNKVMEKTYRSGLQEGESYMMSGSPHEKVNQALHKTLYTHMSQAVSDALLQLSAR